MRALTSFAVLLSAAASAAAHAQTSEQPAVCGPKTATLTRTTLYFGMKRPAGTVSENEWRAFLRTVVTPRFPQGFVVWNAYGQWRDRHGRIEREPSRVLVITRADTADVSTKLSEIIDIYKRRFQQEAVLREFGPICAAF
jgi:hypothetical protein